jgi:hypothetical protein
MPGGNIASWGVQSVRSTLFTNAFDPARVDEVFLKAFRQQPSNYQGAPPGMAFAPSQASGVDKLGQVAVQKYPGRVDFLLTAPLVPTQSVGALPTINDVHGALALIQRIASEMVGSDQVMSRLAFSAEFAESSNVLLDANKTILDILPFSIQLNDELDFSLQFTKRFNSSAVKALKLNFVSRWTVLQVQQVAIAQFASPGTAAFPAVPNFFISQCYLEANTVIEGTALAGGDAPAIFREMREKLDAARRGQIVE